MALVVGTVCVLPVPASGKGDGCPDAALAKACRECLRIRPGAGRPTAVVTASEATVAELFLHSLLLAQTSVSYKHPEAWLERSYCCLSVVWGDVVDRHSSALVQNRQPKFQREVMWGSFCVGNIMASEMTLRPRQ